MGCRMQRTVLDPGKLIAAAILLGACALVVALFLWMVGPAAAREVTSACNGLRPTWRNSKLGKIQAQAPEFEPLRQILKGKPTIPAVCRGL